MAECSVMVGIRIRPFNEREKKLGAQLCVDVDGQTTILQNPPDVAEESGKGKEPKRFTFDASFWSHDGFEEDANGYTCAQPGSKYADQQHVFEVFGKAVLDNAWEGYHCCLFAYGQTGSGKSYSMVGYGANKGIVPKSCNEIFERIARNTDPNLGYEVQVSMVEIYNEQVQDLLLASKDRPKKGLEIRESQQLGIYIDGVRKRAVDSYPAIEAVMDEGTNNRTVGSTLMNATSSRAHTVITIEFTQISSAGGVKGAKVSMINLVDLAGSEKAGQTGAQGDRLKEGCAINKSLSALGNVIEKLAERSSGKSKNVIIPYRDSKLTRLLQNALGGSSKTIMICALSPASSNYEETLSTLRYADRAKRIKNTASINENPQDKLIRQLREENQKLKDLIGEQSPTNGGVSTEEMEERQREVAALEDALGEMQKSFAERLSEAQAQGGEAARQKKETADMTKSLPHIANLNEDDLLTNHLRFAFKEGSSRIGRPSYADEGPEVSLSGPGIQTEHATVVNSGGACTLSANPEAAATTYLNGATLEGKGEVALSHGDRVAFGSCYFVFVDPSAGLASDLLDSGQVSYAMARKELAQKQGEMSGASEEELKASREMAEELERKAHAAEEAKAKAQEEADALLRQREVEFQQQMAQRQKEWEQQLQEQLQERVDAGEQAQKHQQEVERLQREFEQKQHAAEQQTQRRMKELEKVAEKAAAEEEDHRQHELAMQRLEEHLMVMMPLVKEANLIAQELNRPYRLEAKMHCELNGSRRGNVRVTAAVMRDGALLFEWSPETLENRVFLLRELLQRVEEEGPHVADDLCCEDDPLWDPIEVEREIGVAQVLLEGMLLQVENAVDARILSTEGHQAGTLRVEISPLAQDGSVGVPDEEVVDEPEELLGTRMAVQVHVVNASDLPEALATDVRVEFNYFIDDKAYNIPPVSGHHRTPVFNWKHNFVQDPVTSRFIEYLKTKLVFRIYGKDTAASAQMEALAEAERLASETAKRQMEEEAERVAAEAKACEQAEREREAERAAAEAKAREQAQRKRDEAEQAAAAAAAIAAAAEEQQQQSSAPVPTPSQVRRQQEVVATMAKAQDDSKKSKGCCTM